MVLTSGKAVGMGKDGRGGGNSQRMEIVGVLISKCTVMFLMLFT